MAIVSISLGGLVIHAFLTHFVDKQWKDTYIDSWLTLSGLFNGFAQSFHNVVFGRNQFLGFPVFKETHVRDAYRTWGSANWLIPKPIYGDNRVILETPTRQYRISDIPEVLQGDQRSMYQEYFRFNSTADPGVPVDCWYSESNKQTAVAYKTNVPMDREAFYTSNPIPVKTIHGIGDDSADPASLSVCKNWKSTRHVRVVKYCHVCVLKTAKAVSEAANHLLHGPSPNNSTATDEVVVA